MAHVHRLKLAALYTLQDGLSRDAKYSGCDLHGHIARRRFFHEAFFPVVVDADLPRRAGGNLFTGDEPVVDPSMDRGRCGAKDMRRFLHGDQFALGRGLWWLVAGDLPASPQATDTVGREAKATDRFATLAVEDAGDRRVGIMLGKSSQ